MKLASEADTVALGVALGRRLRTGDVVALAGELGAGKTTFARGILRGLGFAGEVASPTFAIVQTYAPPDCRLPVAHVDLYRIEEHAELEQLALAELRREGAMLIEWPERLGEALWPDALRLALERGGKGRRILTATVPTAWEGRWPPT
ncbi:MAG: tRNA (adenosine(37)-N6)-threonylcarbamoyltransferase complex ATPase subunit type 1 TsaE [Sphingomonadaceae bacterium]